MNDSTSNNLPARLAAEPLTSYTPSALTNRASNLVKPDDALTPAFLWRAVRQWWKIALPVGLLLTAVAGSIVWFTFKPTYQATVWLLIKQQPEYLAFKEDTSKSFAQNQVELIRSPVVLEKVLAKPEIAQLPELVQQADPSAWLQKNILTKNQGGSEIFDLSFTGPNAANVAKILNGIIDSYLEVSSQSATEQTERVIQLLTEELERRGKDVERLRDNVRSMAKQVGGTDPLASSLGHGTLVLHSPLDTLQERLVTTQVDREVLEARLKALDESLSATPAELPADVVDQFVEERPEVVKLKEEIDAEQTRQQETERVAQSNYSQGPTRLKSQLEEDEQRLDDLKKRLKGAAVKESVASELKNLREQREEIRQQLTNAQLSEQLLQDRVNKLMAAQGQTGDRSLELEFAKQELDRSESTYQRIAERILALNTEMRAPGRVTLLKRAAVPAAPQVESPVKLLSLVCLAALALPFVLAIGWERRVRRIVEPRQIEEGARLPVIAEIAALPDRMTAGELGTRRLSRDHYLFEESVDSLRTTLALSEQLKDVQVIAVVSAVSREGKTSLAAQLAISLARATGEPVLLIDADLRSPDLHEIFAVPKEPGLAKVLAQGCPVREAIHRTAADSLVYLLPAGKLQKSPHILLSQRNLQSVIDQVRDEYRYVVIDTPPILSASEALAVAKSADGVLICTLSESSRAGQLRHTYERLFNIGARVIGVVLGGVPPGSYTHRYGSYAYGQIPS